MNCERVSFINAAELRRWWNILKKLNSLCIYSYTSILIKTGAPAPIPGLPLYSLFSSTHS